MATIFLAKKDEREFLSGLIDLSAAGLLAPFGWAEFSDEGVPKVLLSIADGRCSVARIQHFINGGFKVINFVQLRVLRERAGSISQQQEIDFFSKYAVPVNVEERHVRVVVPWDQVAVPDFTDRSGWITLIISPEITATPDETPESWWSAPQLRMPIATANIAAVAQIWKNMEQNLQSGYSKAGDLRVVKSYAHAVNTAPIREKLISAVLSYTAQFHPISSESGAEVPILPDSGAAARGMAGEWWQHVRPMLVHAYPVFPTPPSATSIGALAALKQFFSFLWMLIKGMPRAFIMEKITQVRAGIAGSVQNLVYGQDSDFRVIVGGVDAHGRPASWKEMHDRAGRLMQMVSGNADIDQYRVSGLQKIVSHFISAGLTLADASQKDQYIRTPTVGMQPATVDNANWVALDPNQWSMDTDIAHLEATDLLQIDQEIARLNSGYGSVRYQGLKDKLVKWKERITLSFVGNVIQILVGEINAARRMQQQAIARLEQIQKEVDELESQVEDSKKPLNRGRITALISFLLIIATVVLCILFDQPWWLALLLCIIIFIISLAVMIFNFRGFSKISAVEKRLAFLTEKEIPYWWETIFTAAQNVMLISEAQLTISPWARVLSEFIHAPFGRSNEQEETAKRVAHLPDSVKLEDAMISPQEFERIAVQLRRGWQHQGWAHEMWDAFEYEMPKMLTSESQRQRVAAGHLKLMALPYHDQGVQEFMQAIKENGVGDAARKQQEQKLERQHLPEKVMLNNVPVDVETFFQEVSAVPNSATQQSIFTTSAVSVQQNSANAVTVQQFNPTSTLKMELSVYATDRLERTALNILQPKNENAQRNDEAGNSDVNDMFVHRRRTMI